jgi:hypothetical protein
MFKNKSIKSNLENLLNGKSINLGKPIVDFSVENFCTLKEINDGLSVIDLDKDGLNLFYSYLFITGYLTLNTYNLDLTIPNKEIMSEMGNYLKRYYSKVFNIPTEKFTDTTKILDKILCENNKTQISNIFTEEFAPKLSNIIKELKLYGKDKDNVSGVFGNEDMMHSLLNNIAIQVVNARFASERRTTKTDGSKGRADMVVEKNGKGIVIEMKYNAKDSKTALEQAKTYEELVSKSDIKVFVGCNITDKQEVFLSGEITDGFSDPVVFDY